MQLAVPSPVLDYDIDALDIYVSQMVPHIFAPNGVASPLHKHSHTCTVTCALLCVRAGLKPLE
jgi:hypothetical protein